MFYDYIGAIGVMGVLVGVALVHAVITRAVPLRRALLFAGSTAVLTVLLFAPFAMSSFRFFLEETSGSSLLTVARGGEMNMALTLTERGVPFFWGLQLPDVGTSPFVQYIEILGGAAFFLVLLFACCHRGSGLPAAFRLILVTMIGIILLYASRRIGYGVFKLIAWVHPLMVVAFTAGVFALSEWLLARKQRLLGWIALSALPLYLIPNLVLASRIGFAAAFPTRGLSIHNEPNISFADMRELRSVGERWGSEGIVATLPDPVAIGWAAGSLLGANATFFPMILLDVDDSDPRSDTDVPPGRFLLHWNDPVLDVVPLPDCPAVWSNRAFALSPLDRCSNMLVVGQGWYRAESSGTGPSSWMARFRWLRKRGELLLINPISRPQRLRIGMIAGPGNRSSSRAISVFLNGGLVDRFTVVGAARLVTRTFVASRHSNQIEILVDEDAEPLPRRGALWGRWVPGDARRLNVAVTSITLVDANLQTGSLSSVFDLASPNRDEVLFNGFFTDRWTGTEETLTLASPAQLWELRVSGMAPGGVGLPFPFRLTPSFSGSPLAPCEISRAGAFQVHCPIPDSLRRSMRPGQPVLIHLEAEKTFSPRGDPRRLSLQLDRVELAPRSPDVSPKAATGSSSPPCEKTP
jgi:hypothetical protein